MSNKLQIHIKIANLIILSIIPMLGITQTDNSCDLELIKQVDSQITSLSDQLCLQFLKSIDSICLNNVEYQEYSNEIFFKVLESNPLIILRTIDKHRKEINIGMIYDLTREPIHDQVDLQKIKTSIEGLRYLGKAKKEILKSLDNAIINSINKN